jgi:D-alanyl-D-alanine carboxypeptidase
MDIDHRHDNVQSGNDACIALAEVYLPAREENFAQQMNREAQRLGMKRIPSPMPAGLPEQQTLLHRTRSGLAGLGIDPRLSAEIREVLSDQGIPL